MCVTGTMPLRLNNPTVGLSPTTPLSDAGQTIEPAVSVPTLKGAKPAATAAPDPELEPQGVWLNRCGFLVCPPRPLQPSGTAGSRKFAHSLRLVLPRMIAPAALSRCTIKASSAAGCPIMANDPALVCIWSDVSMLSFNNSGIPCMGPRTCPRSRSRSSDLAIASASGLSSMTELIVGPFLSSLSMRCCRCCTSASALSWPRAISLLISSTLKYSNGCALA
ncbi:hypothetical protein D3C73_1050180 [compost metagenome]